MKIVVLDTNVALRFLLADDPHQSPKAKALFEKAEAGSVQLRLTHVAAAELVWVLDSFFQFERSKIAGVVRGLLLHDGIVVDDMQTMLTAIDRFGRVNADFADCYAASVALRTLEPVASYDRDFKKFPDVTALTPEEILKLV